MQKAFDWVDRDLLFFKLLNNNITGKIYWAIKSMYTKTQSCVQLQHTFTDWFTVTNGVKQGDNLSPTLFALYINDLVNELNSLGYGIRAGTYKINILLYADDIVLLAENETILQTRSLVPFPGMRLSTSSLDHHTCTQGFLLGD